MSVGGSPVRDVVKDIWLTYLKKQTTSHKHQDTALQPTEIDLMLYEDSFHPILEEQVVSQVFVTRIATNVLFDIIFLS